MLDLKKICWIGATVRHLGNSVSRMTPGFPKIPAIKRQKAIVHPQTQKKLINIKREIVILRESNPNFSENAFLVNKP